MSPVYAAVLVGLGGAAGAASRHAVGLAVDSRASIVIVNAAGSFVLGLLLSGPVDGVAMLLLGIGYCGAFTTFSSVAVETVTIGTGGDRDTATRFALSTLIAALLALFVGVQVGAMLL